VHLKGAFTEIDYARMAQDTTDISFFRNQKKMDQMHRKTG